MVLRIHTACELQSCAKQEEKDDADADMNVIDTAGLVTTGD
jgi:hypothetical protein